MKRLNFDIEVELYDQLSAQAKQERRTLKAIVVKLLEDYLAKNNKVLSQLPTSKELAEDFGLYKE